MIVTRRAAIHKLSHATVGLALPQLKCFDEGSCESLPDLQDFQSLCFVDAAGVKHQVYVTGEGGPPVILLHEILGLTKETLSTARQLSNARYTAVVPLLFGKPGGSGATGNILRVCGEKQFSCNRGNGTSPHVTWLRQLAQCARTRWTDGKGVGVIGMCLTGTFPIAMLRAPEVVAPVICQPTLPFNRFNPLHAFGWLTNQNALAVDPDDLEYAKRQTTGPLLGLRYQRDRRCKRKRFERLTTEFPNRFFRVDFPGKHHSTLVSDFCADAFNEVLAFFNDHLRTTAEAGTPHFPIQAAHSMSEVTPASCGSSTAHTAHISSSRPPGGAAGV